MSVSTRTPQEIGIPSGDQPLDLMVWDGARWISASLDYVMSLISSLNLGSNIGAAPVSGATYLLIKNSFGGVTFRLDGDSSVGNMILEFFDQGTQIGAISCSLGDAELSLSTQAAAAIPIAFYPGGSQSMRLAVDGTINILGPLAVKDTTPAQITADQNDYNIGLAGSLRLNANAARNITGISGGSDGRLLYIHNVGSFTITLKNESASSSAANRFAGAGGVDLSITSGLSVLLKYDSTSARWRKIS